MAAVSALLVGGATQMASASGGGGTITACDSDGGVGAAQLESALAQGGTWTFTCSGSIYIDWGNMGQGVASGLDAGLTSGGVTTLDATGQTVDIYEIYGTNVNTFRRLLKVTGGSLTLTNLHLHSGHAWATDGSTGTAGTGGGNGTNGGNGGGAGGNGQAGTPGNLGGTGGDGQGGTIYVAGGASLTLNGGSIDAGVARGGQGGTGGGGGTGGQGGTGGPSSGSAGGTGGDGAPGANGGTGGTGGSGEGGGIYIAAGAFAHINGTTITGGEAQAGQGGTGGTGGRGGNGGGGGTGSTTTGQGGNAAAGGDGGTGGVSGAGHGGAIYNDGDLTISDATFGSDGSENFSGGGNGGGGGDGGTGGGSTLAGGNGASGGNGGGGGPGGDAEGGAIYNAGTMTITQATFSGDVQYMGQSGNFLYGIPGGGGGQGGLAGNRGCPSGCTSSGTDGAKGGDGGAGGDAGFAAFASIAGSVAGVSCAHFSASRLFAGSGGAGGPGSGGGSSNTTSVQGANGPSGATGTTGTVDPTISKGCGLNVSVQVLGPDDQAWNQADMGLNKPLKVKVTVTNSAAAPAPATSVTPDAIQVSPSSALASNGSPTYPNGPPPWTLAPGDSKSFTQDFTVARLGQATISDSASWMQNSAAQTPVMGSQTVILGKVLAVKVTYSKNDFKLDSNDKGPIPQDITATVKVTNNAGYDVNNVTVDPTPSITPTGATPDPPVHVKLNGPASPSDGVVGTLSSGQSGTVTFPLKVSDDGDVSLQAVITGDDPETGNPVHAQGSAELSVGQAAPLFLKAQLSPDTLPLTPTDQQLSIVGYVENRSHVQAIDLNDLAPTVGGNAQATPAYDADHPPPPGEYPLPINGKLKPGEIRYFRIDVTPTPGAGTRGQVELAPTGSLINADGSKTALKPSEIRVAEGSSPILVHLDDTAPVDIPNSDWRYVAGEFAYTFWSTGVQSLHGSFQALFGLLPAIGHAIANVKPGIIAAWNFGYRYWTSLTPAQKDEFFTTVAVDWANYRDKKLSEVYDQVKASVTSYMNAWDSAWANGDWIKLADLTGKAAGTTVGAIVDWYLWAAVGKGIKGAAKLVSAAKVPSAETVIKLIDKLPANLSSAKNLPALLGALQPGADLLADGAKVLRKGYGMTRRQIGMLQHWAQERGLLIAVRFRNPVSEEWIKAFKAVLKPEELKIKNVDQIDTLIGYHPDDVGSVVFAQPIGQEELAKALARAPNAEVRAAMQKRYDLRVKEWKKWEANYKSMKTIRTSFDGRPNGVDFHPEQSRKFQLTPVNLASGREYFQVEIADAGGRLRRVTGDVDIVGIMKADGSLLTDAERLEIYKELCDEAGFSIQHGDTFSWLDNGMLLSDDKAKLLADHVPGGEPLAVFNPVGGVTAGFVNPALTWFNTATRTGRAYLEGAYTSPVSLLSKYNPINLLSIGGALSY